MKARIIGLLCGLIGIGIIFYPQPQEAEAPKQQDKVHEAFQTYEKLWREHTLNAAEKIKKGDLKTEQEIWDFLAAGQKPAREIAFEEIGKKEQEYFDKNGGWSLKNHEAVLRSYSK